MIAPSALRHSKSHRQASIRNINLRAKRMMTRYELEFQSTKYATLAARQFIDDGASVSEHYNTLKMTHTVVADFKNDPKIVDWGGVFRVVKKEQVRKP